MPAYQPEIEAIIIYGNQAEKCEVSCGLDWSLAENMTMAEQQVEARFSDRVRLKFLDLSEPATGDFALKWQKRVRDQKLPLPLLVIDGLPRISGEFDMRMLLSAIDTEIEIRT